MLDPLEWYKRRASRVSVAVAVPMGVVVGTRSRSLGSNIQYELELHVMDLAEEP